MTESNTHASVSVWPNRFRTWIPSLLLVVAGALAYSNSLKGPFILDDIFSLIEDTSTRTWSGAFNPPKDLTISGRPILALSLALNYKIHGLEIAGYHIFNLLIHIGSALLLFRFLKMTLVLPSVGPKLNKDALPLAFAIAMIWVVHPLCTQAVTYIIQRAESLMAFFYIGTLCAYTKALKAESPRPWYILSTGACLLGMATKEVMVSAPVAVILYDGIFVTQSLRETLRQRWKPLLALFSTWIPLVYLILSLGGNRGGSTGATEPGMWTAYWLTQAPAIATYLKLSVWPTGLALDYGPFWIENVADIWSEILLVVSVVGLTVWALLRRPAVGYLGWFFFAILAPSSLMPGKIQMIAEHRMYLALIPVIVLVVLGIHWINSRRFLWAVLPIAAVLSLLTFRRNDDYRTAHSIWYDTVSKRPKSFMGRNNLGIAYLHMPGHESDAAEQFRAALRLEPTSDRPKLNLAVCLLANPETEKEGTVLLQEIIHNNPNDDHALQNLARAWTKYPSKRYEALDLWSKVLSRHPDWASAHLGLGSILAAEQETRAKGVAHLRKALELDPKNVEALSNLGLALGTIPGMEIEGLRYSRQAAALNPFSAGVLTNFGVVSTKVPGSRNEAVLAFRKALSIDASYHEAAYHLGNLLLEEASSFDEGITVLEGLLRLSPEFHDAHVSLGIALNQIPARAADSIHHFREACRLNPDSLDDHFNLGTALSKSPETRALAIREFEICLRINPADSGSRQALESLANGLKE